MKTILKLLFIGLVAGLTYKYVSENNIDVGNILNSAKEKASSFAEEIIEKIEIGTSDQATESSDSFDFSEDNNTYYDTYSASVVNTEKEHEYQPENITDAIEFPVAMKSSSNIRFAELDRYAWTVPDNYTLDLVSLVSYLVQPAATDIEKARVLFSWIAANIHYDDYGYNTGNYGDPSAQGVFSSRKAVCDGFSELFMSMGKVAGLEIEKVSGYSKGYGYRPGQSFSSTNHAWNAIRIDGQWKLFDVTWGRGSGQTVNGQLKSIMDFDEFWFDTDPYSFIFSHLPEDSKWQLIENPVSKSAFENMPYVYAAYFKMGFDGRTCFEQYLNGSFTEFPLAYSVNSEVKAISLPHTGVITEGNPVRFTLKSSEAKEMSVINNGKWIYLKKQGDEFTADFYPSIGELSVNAKFDENSSSFESLLKYEVR